MIADVACSRLFAALHPRVGNWRVFITENTRHSARHLQLSHPMPMKMGLCPSPIPPVGDDLPRRLIEEQDQGNHHEERVSCQL